MDQFRVGGCVGEVEYHRQVLVVDVDDVECVVRLVGGAGDHDGNRFTGEVDGIDGQRRCGRSFLVFGDRPRARQAPLLLGEVGARVHGDDARHLLRFLHIDAGDAGV